MIDSERYSSRRDKLGIYYFWACIKYIHDCHVSGELQGLTGLI
ncbi:hypothetical protein CBU03nite_37470 [Clostridium butyricum]|uniref:Transposase n=1 Tax=Clostridium butyricum TaxID=1492 RepID=A0A512TU06_CLOBU|nr:hypothetical protein CBY_1236 [Clostridium butyricum 5521]KIU06272.1 hypothetical protein SC08_Contig83orf00002 [Clostridium butyricum]KJZ86242.1 hypothetical protein ClosIBUN125C_CONTIG43g02541 [Clostridium sp. IBUN125C]KJZ87371.1 hypothetical protein ClosIBUN22A_CONTIG54g01084 [Clostridium sp. IBUN22A]KJZ91088.1 hypothetical protein ClosIBUN13A_CONTIG238g03763 [Clostridium sp. IBUN13A]KJZ92429.1 hypothetical protein ClosIBUN62F_CONTIG53g02042 [Clostridium sp. IBUN62F]